MDKIIYVEDLVPRCVHLYISAKIPAFTSNLMLTTESQFLFIKKRKHMITTIALYQMQTVP